MLWGKCPKTQFCGKRQVNIAVSQTVALFNVGAGSDAVLLKSCGVSPGKNTVKALHKKDKQRLYHAAKKNC